MGMRRLAAADPNPGQDPRVYTDWLTATLSIPGALAAGDIDIWGHPTQKAINQLNANLAAENPNVSPSQIASDTSAAMKQYGQDPSQTGATPFDSSTLLKYLVIGGIVLFGGIAAVNSITR